MSTAYVVTALVTAAANTFSGFAGTAAAAGLVLYFVCALFTHLRVGDRSPMFALAGAFLALAVATLALDPAVTVTV